MVLGSVLQAFWTVLDVVMQELGALVDYKALKMVVAVVKALVLLIVMYEIEYVRHHYTRDVEPFLVVKSWLERVENPSVVKAVGEIIGRGVLSRCCVKCLNDSIPSVILLISLAEVALKFQGHVHIGSIKHVGIIWDVIQVLAIMCSEAGKLGQSIGDQVGLAGFMVDLDIELLNVLGGVNKVKIEVFWGNCLW